MINAVSFGGGAITAANSGLSVYVNPPYSGPTILYVKPVSVKLPFTNTNKSSAPVYANPVSVINITPSPNLTSAPAYANPVSVINLIPIPNTSSASVFADPVSTAISNSGGQ